MANLGDIKGLSDFKEKLNFVEKKAPGKIYAKYDEAAKELKRKIKNVTPYQKNGRYDGKKKTSKQHLRGRWKTTKTRKNDGVYHVELYSTAPHFHLVERGHEVVARRANKKNSKKDEQYRVKLKNGKSFVHGLNFYEREMERLEPELNALPEKILDEILDDLFEGWD
ncbi:HK97 gp10 family phage protein [Peptoniphilus asaccharolyticus]